MLEFEWDPAKAATNLKKHGVSFREAQEPFVDDRAIRVYDEEHSGSEDRIKLIGMSNRLRILLVVYAEITEDLMRIISARRATRSEQQLYEENIPPQ